MEKVDWRDAFMKSETERGILADKVKQLEAHNESLDTLHYWYKKALKYEKALQDILALYEKEEVFELTEPLDIVEKALKDER